MISESQDRSILQWAQNRIRNDLKMDVVFDPMSCVTLTAHDEDSIHGVAVVYNWNPPANVELAVVTDSPKWCTKRFIKRVFDYCFNELEVNRVYAQVKSNNDKALDMNERLGFKRIAVLPDFYVTNDGEVCDNHVLSMTKNECKWL